MGFPIYSRLFRRLCGGSVANLPHLCRQSVSNPKFGAHLDSSYPSFTNTFPNVFVPRLRWSKIKNAAQGTWSYCIRVAWVDPRLILYSDRSRRNGYRGLSGGLLDGTSNGYGCKSFMMLRRSGRPVIEHSGGLPPVPCRTYFVGVCPGDSKGISQDANFSFHRFYCLFSISVPLFVSLSLSPVYEQ
jgi:hypothetical protein